MEAAGDGKRVLGGGGDVPGAAGGGEASCSGLIAASGRVVGSGAADDVGIAMHHMAA